jgi:ATP-dependent Lhr-like helicase
MPRVIAPDDDALALFLAPVAAWFRDWLGEPTLPQRMGWPAIAAGQNTLIVAPTGSGKTLAAFLAALDLLWRMPRRQQGVRILYVSPLKALGEDVRRNLETPLAGILERSRQMGSPLGTLNVAVRSGDTPSSQRARLLRKPPDILITTPESLHLMLTSRARETLRNVSHVIVDEIHAVCSNKRGVFLALLLERLEAICAASFVRVGLSATQRPLELVARFLGGQRLVKTAGGGRRFEPRPVTIIDAGRRKTMDLQVLWPGGDEGRILGPPGSIWPAIEERLLSLTAEHRSTIIFANNRRTVEKLTARLNETALTELPEVEFEPESEPSSAAACFRAHHGSLSLEERRSTEEELKRGALRGVVSTASLELGIDMGDVDLVCQIESPGNIARGLQRVGRAGHVVHGVSKGRLIAKTPADLLETAALARAMIAGDIEPLAIPRGCLDVLAQQVVACVAMDAWTVPDLFDLVRCADPYAQLDAEAFESVLRLVSGRFPTGSLRDLRARIVWDRIHNRLAPLPGTARLALVGGGTIPDTGQYPVFLGDGGPRLGELDEEFVFERRVGENFALGNNTWRIDAIEPHRVLVSPAGGNAAVMPFWRGEGAPRSSELGEAIGTLCREISGRPDNPELPAWLQEECHLEPRAARVLIRHVARQARVAGVVPDDRTILLETFRDPAGELSLAILSPWGGKVHHALKIALSGLFRQRFGIQASCLHGDDGLLFRLPQTDAPPLDLLEGLNSDLAETFIRQELPETALYGLRFRQNAARALLMPRPDPSKRTPLWLQRLRAKDLLQVVGRFPDFPIVVETFRECLSQDLDLPRLRFLLDHIQAGKIRVHRRQGEIASPFASELIFEFTPAYIYQWDEPRRPDLRSPTSAVDFDLLDSLLEESLGARPLDPQAVGRVESRLRHRGHPPRTAAEMAETLRTLGDLATSDLFGPMERLLDELKRQDLALKIELPSTGEPPRWILAEEERLYQSAFPARGEPDLEAAGTIVRRYVQTHALVGITEILRRYPLAPELATAILQRWVDSGGAIRLNPAEGSPESGWRWAEWQNLGEIHRLSVAIRRRESVAVAPEVFADFLIRRQHLHPASRLERPGGLETALLQLQGYAASAIFWESEILPRRVRGYRPSWLDDLLASGGWIWRGSRDGQRDEPAVALALREFAGGWPVDAELPPLSEDALLVLDHLAARGASFAVELARAAGLEPSRLRRALFELLLRGRLTNDRFDPLRPGGSAMLEALDEARETNLRQGRRLRPRRANPGRPEGRWSVIPSTPEASDESRVAWISVLLARYGVLAHEILGLEPWAPAWADLAPLLARAELRDGLRRGYFVEGLSGVQYATEEAASELARLAGLMAMTDDDVLLSASDPANLYGSGAPLDIPLIDGGTARLVRTSGNFLVVRRGRPVLVIEASGKRLTGLASASQAELDAALTHLIELAHGRGKALKVETYNGQPAVTSAVAPRLTELGFVRDYPAMTYYPAWASVADRRAAGADVKI